MEEEWKPIVGFENYSISNLCNVKNNKTNRILCTRVHKGYRDICLYKNKKLYNCSIHRLIALSFIPNPENKRQIDHIDRNSLNNDISNLRWVSHGENQRNKNKQKNCSSQFKGISFDKYHKLWKASICINNKIKHLGYYTTEATAYEHWKSFVIENNLAEFYNL